MPRQQASSNMNYPRKLKTLTLPAPRPKVPGLKVQILIERTDSMGRQVSAEMALMTGNKMPFDRINPELRQTMHNNLDRLLNDVNRIWNKTFSPETSSGTVPTVSESELETVERLLSSG